MPSLHSFQNHSRNSVLLRRGHIESHRRRPVRDINRLVPLIPERDVAVLESVLDDDGIVLHAGDHVGQDGGVVAGFGGALDVGAVAVGAEAGFGAGAGGEGDVEVVAAGGGGAALKEVEYCGSGVSRCFHLGVGTLEEDRGRENLPSHSVEVVVERV